jgi:hypothetical protein
LYLLILGWTAFQVLVGISVAASSHKIEESERLNHLNLADWAIFIGLSGIVAVWVTWEKVQLRPYKPVKPFQIWPF